MTKTPPNPEGSPPPGGKAVPMSRSERGRLGGRATGVSRTPEQKKEIGRRAHLAGAVNSIVDHFSELTPEQVERLRATFGPGAPYGPPEAP